LIVAQGQFVPKRFQLCFDLGQTTNCFKAASFSLFVTALVFTALEIKRLRRNVGTGFKRGLSGVQPGNFIGLRFKARRHGGELGLHLFGPRGFRTGA
jgi:hypothetical protein